MKKFILIILFLCTLTACSSVKKNDVAISKTENEIGKNAYYNVEFLKNQNLEEKIIVNENYQKVLDKYFNKKYFSVWKQDKESYTKEIAFWGNRFFPKKDGYGENKQSITIEELQKLIDLTDEENYPNMFRKAITLRTSNLRVLPTNKPFYYDFSLPGEGYPFDNLQNSGIWANTPLLITQISKDGKWVMTENHVAIGWLPIEDIAFVDEAFINEWLTNKYIAIIKDEIPIYDKNSSFLIEGRIGMLFPTINDFSTNKERTEILIAVSNNKKEAVIKKGYISTENSVIKPLKYTNHNMISLIKETIDKKYGWGGSFENRDCSSTLKDIFTPFGIYLPRNSTAQAHYGNYFSLENLDDKTKENLILTNAIPFATLICKRGHIMLYVGQDNEKSLVFHNLWGLKTKDGGRHVIGKTIISETDIGNNIPDVDIGILRFVNGISNIFPSINYQKQVIKVLEGDN